ncbi:MAG: TIGR01777 family protein [Desulfovibrionaceae bacterium]|nr:TIGR01777 family protein [Desulfovibrionaceae bacterium]MBF0512941.1 TIGR01777 family protein [Desulfovibrionaceae bacterium]
MRFVVAGGSGFIGRELTRLLLASGHEAIVLGRTPRQSGQSGQSGDARLRFAVWDGVNQGEWSSAVDGADAVVNLAGADIAGKRWTARYKELLLRSRIDSTQALTRAIEAAGVKPGVVIQGSAVGYYGNLAEPSDESAPRGEGFLAELAGRWEEAGAGVESLGIRRCVVRTGLVLGAGGILARMLPAFRLYAGAVFGSGAQGFAWIHVADEARAILFLAQNSSASGAYNLTAPEGVDLNAFCAALGERLGRPVYFRAPAFMLKALLGEMARELLLSGCLAKPARLLEAGFVFRFARLRAALADLVPAPGV